MIDPHILRGFAGAMHKEAAILDNPKATAAAASLATAAALIGGKKYLLDPWQTGRRLELQNPTLAHQLRGPPQQPHPQMQSMHPRY